MGSFVITWRELLIIVVLVLAVYVAEMLLLMRFGSARRFSFGRKDSDGAMQVRVPASVTEELASLKEKVASLEREVQHLKTSSQHNVTPYSQAIQLAQQGLDAGEVAASCGISRGEAELIVALYRSHSS